MEVPDVGRPVEISSENWQLSGWFVVPEGPARSAVLLFHGIGDRTYYWRSVQRHLASSGICSLVFRYSGYPGSGGSTTPENLSADSAAAYAWIRDHLPAGVPVYLLGFSLGSGLAAQIAGSLRPIPAGLILAESFPSLREAAGRLARPLSALRYLLPDVWDTCSNVAKLRLPVLILHLTGDTLFPPAMAKTIHAAAQAGGAPAELRILAGRAHNAPYLTVPEDYWAEVLAFIARTSAGPESTSAKATLPR